jgi:hypothetical protein
MGKSKAVTFIAAVDFTGYPFGAAHLFKAGEPSIPVPESYAALMRDKGLVKAGTDFTAVAEPKAEK